MTRPLLVIVGGAPGAGKTTVARELAHRLRLALITKDHIKEALGDALGVGDRERSRQLGVAAYAVMWSVARRTLEAGAGVVLCRADPAVRRRRYEERADRHPVHTDAVILEREWREDDAVHAIDLGVPRLIVDTTSGHDVARIVSWIARPSD